MDLAILDFSTIGYGGLKKYTKKYYCSNVFLCILVTKQEDIRGIKKFMRSNNALNLRFKIKLVSVTNDYSFEKAVKNTVYEIKQNKALSFRNEYCFTDRNVNIYRVERRFL